MLEPLPLMLQLCQTILLPTLLGAAVRGFIPGETLRPRSDPKTRQDLQLNHH
jgi:hypothetical protein